MKSGNFSNRFWIIIAATSLTLSACFSGSQKPIDGKTRQIIDSTALAEQRKAKVQVDSICRAERIALLPHLIDSIKQIRLKEIAEKMKSVPK